MNNYENCQELYEDIELACLFSDTRDDAEQYLKPLRELIVRYTILEDALTRACNRIEFENNGGKMDEGPKCPAISYAFMPRCCNENFCDGSNAECWKEWCMHMAKQKNRN